MKKQASGAIKASRWKQAFNKFIFCLRIAAGQKTLVQLLLTSKLFSRYQKKNVAEERHKTGKALPYNIRYLSRRRSIYLRTYTGDIRMFYEIFWEQAYWLPPSFLPPSLVIVDAGANIGMASLYFSIIYPNARIYCIEPDANNFNLLQKNLSHEKETGNAVLLQAALYERDGVVGLAGEGWSYNSKVYPSSPAHAEKTVQAITVKRFFEQFGLDKIDLLKMDIEGAEENLFSSDTEWLQKVDAILIEIHTVTGIELIRNSLTEHGFYWYAWDRSKAAATLFLASRKKLAGTP